LLIIMVGFLVIFKDQTSKTISNIVGNTSEDSKKEKIEVVAIMSGHQGNIATQDFRGGSITAIMGGADLDLRNASIDKEAVLNVFAVWGGISLKIPNDWSVVNNGVAIMGGIDDTSVPNMNANKRLIITGTVIMGGVEIKN
jgi:predicted membrane protein